MIYNYDLKKLHDIAHSLDAVKIFREYIIGTIFIVYKRKVINKLCLAI